MQSYFGFLAGEDLVKGPSSFVDLASAQKEFISKVLAPGHLMVLKSVTMTVVVILVQPLSSVQLFKTPHGQQHIRPHCPYYLPVFAQVHVHWVGDAIQPSHPLPPSSPFTFNLSQHQDLFQ